MSNHPNIIRLPWDPKRRGQNPIHEKSWGYEVWIANSELYCGKKLVIVPLKSSSLHFHVKKTEHIYVQHGELELQLIENKQETLHTLYPGDWVLITPGLVHKLLNPCTDKNTVLFEFSTEHFDDDSYRIE